MTRSKGESMGSPSLRNSPDASGQAQAAAEGTAGGSHEAFTPAAEWVARPDPSSNPGDHPRGDFVIGVGDAIDSIAVCSTIEHARLIAAAPRLLKELRQLVRCLRPWIEAGHRVPGIATLNGADAAIRKATAP